LFLFYFSWLKTIILFCLYLMDQRFTLLRISLASLTLLKHANSTRLKSSKYAKMSANVCNTKLTRLKVMKNKQFLLESCLIISWPSGIFNFYFFRLVNLNNYMSVSWCRFTHSVGNQEWPILRQFLSNVNELSTKINT